MSEVDVDGTPWDLDRVADLVGTEVVYTSPDPIGAAAIRYFATAIGATNPVYTDREAARAAGHPDIVAPPTMLAETNQYVTGRETDAHGYRGHLWDVGFTGTRLVRGGNAYEFGVPATPDTVVTATWRITAAEQKTGRDGTPMLFLTSEATYTDQDGRVLLVDTETIIHQPLPGATPARRGGGGADA